MPNNAKKNELDNTDMYRHPKTPWNGKFKSTLEAVLRSSKSDDCPELFIKHFSIHKKQPQITIQIKYQLLQ